MALADIGLWNYFCPITRSRMGSFIAFWSDRFLKLIRRIFLSHCWGPRLTRCGWSTLLIKRFTSISKPAQSTENALSHSNGSVIFSCGSPFLGICRSGLANHLPHCLFMKSIQTLFFYFGVFSLMSRQAQACNCISETGGSASEQAYQAMTLVLAGFPIIFCAVFYASYCWLKHKD